MFTNSAQLTSMMRMAVMSRFHQGIPLIHGRPVDDAPERFDIVGPHVLVLQVVGVFPDVEHEQRDRAPGDVELMIARLKNNQPRDRFVGEDAPAVPLNLRGGGREVGFQLVERAELRVDIGGERLRACLPWSPGRPRRSRGANGRSG